MGRFKVNHPNTRAQYAADLTKYMEIMDELQHSLMHPNQRAVLETCAEALQVVLELYDIDYKIDNR